VPNPFNPSTGISFEMGAAGAARLNVYDTAGSQVRTPVDAERAAGRHTVTWDGRNESGRNAPAGVYLYRFEAGESVQTQRMTLVK
jgi:flagellar hook assembly protein FlgD